ncbi:hypothetical protein [Thiomicrorhabdus arctica]|uniref:hypothetical protein n=1 Tax=Thiomicrorhabdus arctica TaxID=131540 RepID=UPI000382B12F|nr:hypothetical protein [Thiomicrorhabdus arctica]
MKIQLVTTQILLKALLVMSLTLLSNQAFADSFRVGETVFIAYPAGNIKDDAFIIGKIQGINDDGDYQISVLDFVEGHDYGLSCVPMIKKENSQAVVSEYGQGWDLWQDTTTLEKEKLDYLVSKADVMKLGKGKRLFIERNNLYIVFGRWKSDAPMLTVDRLTRAEQEAASNQMEGLLPALALVKLHRLSFYDEYGRPKQPFETIAPLNKALSSVLELFSRNKMLQQVWMSHDRDWTKISKDMQTYFLVEAIDKIVADATKQQYQEGVEQAGEHALNTLKSYLSQLKRDPA